MEHVEVNGGTLTYAATGTGEPIVCIHGALVADAFKPLLSEPSLASRYRIITYHRPGYGRSMPVNAVSISGQAADCRALLTHLGLARAHIIGHSYGGLIALQLGLDSPDFVHSLAVIEPGLMIGASGGPYRAALARGRERYREAEASVVVDEFLEARSPGYRPRLDALLPGAFARAVTDAPTWFNAELAAQLAWHFDAASARRITQPVLSVVGEKSAALWDRFGETHRWLLDSLPNAEEFVLPGATHLPQIEQPRALAEGLAAFFARHPLPG